MRIVFWPKSGDFYLKMETKKNDANMGVFSTQIVGVSMENEQADAGRDG